MLHVDVGCQFSCTEHFSEEERKTIHSKYWQMDYNSRKIWLGALIMQKRAVRKVTGNDDLLEMNLGYSV